VCALRTQRNTRQNIQFRKLTQNIRILTHPSRLKFSLNLLRLRKNCAEHKISNFLYNFSSRLDRPIIFSELRSTWSQKRMQVFVKSIRSCCTNLTETGIFRHVFAELPRIKFLEYLFGSSRNTACGISNRHI